MAGVQWPLPQHGSGNRRGSNLLIKTKIHFFSLYFCQWLNLTPLLIFSTANYPPREELASLEESRKQLVTKGPVLAPCSCFPGKMAITILVNSKAEPGHPKIKAWLGTKTEIKPDLYVTDSDQIKEVYFPYEFIQLTTELNIPVVFWHLYELSSQVCILVELLVQCPELLYYSVHLNARLNSKYVNI